MLTTFNTLQMNIKSIDTYLKGYLGSISIKEYKPGNKDILYLSTINICMY
jgi:hypothetical protein